MLHYLLVTLVAKCEFKVDFIDFLLLVNYYLYIGAYRRRDYG